MSIINEAQNYYRTYDVDKRIKKDQAHKVEFILSMHVLEKLFSERHISCAIDIGCGTGNYTVELAGYCDRIIACDMMPDFLETVRNKAIDKRITNIKYLCSNAVDLSSIQTSSCDIVLCMGPLYHLSEPKERALCMSEVKRIMKPDAICVFTYITTRALWANVKYGKMSLQELCALNENKCIRSPFYFSSPSETEREIEEMGFTIIDHCALDAITSFCFDDINALEQKDYEMWINLMISHMRDSPFLEFSSHNMIVARGQMNETNVSNSSNSF